MSVVIAPRRLRTVCRATAALVVVVFTSIAVVLPRGVIQGRQFGVPDQILFFLLGVATASGVLWFTRFRVRADDSGVWVRNGGGERYFAWGVVEGIRMTRDSPWAELMLRDDQRVALMAIQAHDGVHAQQAVADLRALLPGTGGASVT